MLHHKCGVFGTEASMGQAKDMGMYVQDGREELAKRVNSNLSRHKGLLGNFLRDLEDQVEVINTFEDFAGPDPSIEFTDDAGHHFAQASVFAKVCFCSP